MIFRGPSSPWSYHWFYIWNPCRCLALQAIPLFELNFLFCFVLLIHGSLLPVSKVWDLCITLESSPSPYSPSGVNFWNSMYYLTSFHGPCRSCTWRSLFTIDHLWIDLPFPGVLSLSRPLSLPFLSFFLPPSLPLSLPSFFLFLLNWRGNASMQSPLSVLLGQSCPTLCSTMDCRPSGSSVHGILQTGILEWVAISSSGDLRNPRIECAPLVSPALTAKFFTSVPPGSPYTFILGFKNLFAP